MGRLGIARWLASGLTCVALAGWAIASCTFPEYNFSETEAGLNLPAHCQNKAKDADETDVDCGGSCVGCGLGLHCTAATDCAKAMCLMGTCQDASCTNKVKDGTETDVDCGGAGCGKCEVGKGCALGSDCTAGVCLAGGCAPPACDDRVQNADESDVDCGGMVCPKCGAEQKCVVPTDCISGDCAKGLCTPTCADGLASCDGDSTNGCETNIRTDPNHCGGCGTACKLPNATADCSGSICRVATCA